MRVVSMPSTTTVRPPGREVQSQRAARRHSAHRRGNGRAPTSGGSTAAPRWWASTALATRPRAGAVQALWLHRRQTWPPPSSTCWPQFDSVLGFFGFCTVAGLFSIKSRGNYGYQDWYQRFWPHWPQRVPRVQCRTSRTSKWSASTTCSSPTTWPTCSSTTACMAASRATWP